MTKMKKLLGMVNSSEKLSHLRPPSDTSEGENKRSTNLG